MPQRRAGDDDELASFGLLGTASTLSADGRRPRHVKPTREFPPGFHGAAPGPSFDEEPPKRVRRRTKTTPKPGG